jgi:hypothetical protein
VPSFGINSPVPLIMLGLGPEPRLVTSGFSPVILRTISAIRGGRAAYKKLISEYEQQFKISAMIISTNGREIINPIANKISRIFLENNINIRKTFAKDLYWKRAKRPTIQISDLQIEHRKIDDLKVIASHKSTETKKIDFKINAKRKIK